MTECNHPVLRKFEISDDESAWLIYQCDRCKKNFVPPEPFEITRAVKWEEVL